MGSCEQFLSVFGSGDKNIARVKIFFVYFFSRYTDYLTCIALHFFLH